MEANMEPEYDWQSGKSIIECNRHMWAHELLCDVTFCVGLEGEEIKAHKYVLASRSCVFYAMFSNPTVHQQGQTVVIPDVEPEIFKMLMKFLYTGEIELDLEKTLNILNAARTYAVQGLVEKCLNRLKSNLTANSVFHLMEVGHANDNEELLIRCLNFILKDPAAALGSDSIEKLSSECLSLIFKEETLSLKEEEIFFVAKRYASLKCRAKGLEETGENMQSVLGPARTQIRFPCMSQKFFSDVVQESGLLTDIECVKVYKYFINPENGCDIFKTTPRSMQRKVSRFVEVAKGWGYKRDKQDAITFQCSNDVIIEGVELYGASDETANYEVNLMLMQPPFYSLLERKHAIVETNSKDQTFKLMFDQPVIIERNRDYAICLVCRGPPSYYGVRGKAEIEDDGVWFRFMSNTRSTNNSCVERGQIASILYTSISRQAMIN